MSSSTVSWLCQTISILALVLNSGCANDNLSKKQLPQKYSECLASIKSRLGKGIEISLEGGYYYTGFLDRIDESTLVLSTDPSRIRGLSVSISQINSIVWKENNKPCKRSFN